MAEDGFYILRATLCWLPVFEAVHALLFWISKRIHGPEVKVVHHEWANLLISVMQAMVSGVSGAYALMYEEPFASTAAKVFRFETPTDTVHGYSATLQQGLPFICAYFAYDLLNMVLFVSSEALMVAHHILCLLVWPVSFHYRAGQFYVIYFMAAELSTPVVWTCGYFLPLYGCLGLPFQVAGTLLVFIFFGVRILPSPGIWWSLVSSQASWADFPGAIYAVAMLTLPLPSALFIYWWVGRILLPWLREIKKLLFKGEDVKKD